MRQETLAVLGGASCKLCMTWRALSGPFPLPSLLQASIPTSGWRGSSMFEELLEQIARGLDSLGIPYMLIGGQAVLVHGEPRLTRDVVVTLGAGPEKLPVVLEWVGRTGWQVLADSPADFVARTLVLPCLEPASGIRVDLIFSYSAYELQAIPRARVITVGQTQVRFASAEDLVIHELVAGRPRDIDDVRSIVLKNPGLDAGYVQLWLRELDKGLQEDFVSRFEELWSRSRKADC